MVLVHLVLYHPVVYTRYQNANNQEQKIRQRRHLCEVRSLIAYKDANDRIFCLFVFPKNETENITKSEEKQLKFLAKLFLKLNDKDLKNALDTGVLIEVPANDDEE